MRWQTSDGQTIQGKAALQAHLTSLNAKAETETGRIFADSRAMMQMAYLRDLYNRYAGSNINAASKARFARERDIIDKYALRMGRVLTPKLFAVLPKAERDEIKAQVDASIAQDIGRTNQAPYATGRE